MSLVCAAVCCYGTNDGRPDNHTTPESAEDLAVVLEEEGGHVSRDIVELSVPDVIQSVMKVAWPGSCRSTSARGRFARGAPMELTAELRPSMKHVQVPSPGLVLFANLLALGRMDLEHAIASELDENPGLTVLDGSLCPDCGRRSRGGRCRRCCPTASGLDVEVDVAAHPGWRAVLIEQARLTVRSALSGAVELVVGCLDERGFLVGDDLTLARTCRVSLDAFRHIVDEIRKAGPAGIAAHDVRECLLYQLDACEADDTVSLARRVISAHLTAFAQGHDSAVARALDVDASDIAKVRSFVRRQLHPHVPLGDEVEPGERTVRPDVVITPGPGVPNTFVVEVKTGRAGRLRVDEEFRRLAPHDSTGCVQRLVDRAEFFLLRLEQRTATLHQIASVVVEREAGYLRAGASGYVPLTRADVAAELGMSASTVSRATAGKYVQLPSGRIVPFTTFFDTALAVRHELCLIITAEPRALSDAELSVRLRDRGYRVARRTVAKYRQALLIGAAAHR